MPVLDLPADPPAPEIPALDVLQGTFGSKSVGDGPAFLSELLFYCAAISATKRVPSGGYEYALRVNPSSGNLHPTEFHFVTRGLKDWPDGLYHYDPSRHMAEQRGRGTFETRLASDPAPIVFVLTSIVWREAWKYGERAYRYCLHDIGHAWQALALSARAIGCNTFAVGSFVDDEVAQLCRPNGDEWPMLIVSLHGKSIPVREADTGKTVWFGGQANLLSKESIPQPLIDSIHISTKQSSSRGGGSSFAEPVSTGSDGIELPPPASSTRSFGEVARMRRSALNFIGREQSISLTRLAAILARQLNLCWLTLQSPVSFSFIFMFAHVDQPDPVSTSLAGVAARAGENRTTSAGKDRCSKPRTGPHPVRRLHDLFYEFSVDRASSGRTRDHGSRYVRF